MHIFDYGFLHKGMVSANLLNLTSTIYTLKSLSAFRLEDFASIFQELQKIAKIQSVKHSNAIEGIVTTDERIQAIVNQNCAPLNHSEVEIAGYRDALNEIHLHHESITFSEATVLNLHRKMTGRGVYKTSDNVILETDANGVRSVRFNPVSAADTPDAMRQLFLAWQEAAQNDAVNPLLLIPCVVLDFLCIHPFSDGNGRLSRLISLLLLYRAGFDVGKYISFEEQINLAKGSYYDVLKRSSDGWMENHNDYFPFIENFIYMLYRSYKELDQRFAVVNSRKITKHGRIEATVVNSLTPISKAEICRILPDISPTTVEAVLHQMLVAGRVQKIGSGRATRYVGR